MPAVRFSTKDVTQLQSEDFGAHSQVGQVVPSRVTQSDAQHAATVLKLGHNSANLQLRT